MSMAAKLSNLSDKTSEANLQVDGQADKPAKGATDWQEKEEEDSSPHHSLTWPCPEATIRPPQYEALLRNTSVFNR